MTAYVLCRGESTSCIVNDLLVPCMITCTRAVSGVVKVGHGFLDSQPLTPDIECMHTLIYTLHLNRLKTGTALSYKDWRLLQDMS